MFNSIQLFGLLLLGGLAAGETARRFAGLPRATGHVLFGMLAGQSGLMLVAPQDLAAAQPLVDLALGLILFDLGYQVPRDSLVGLAAPLRLGAASAAGAGALVLGYLLVRGHPAGPAAYAAALCTATSPALTVATCRDLGAHGPRTGLVYALVVVNGAIAFMLLALLQPFFVEGPAPAAFAAIGAGLGTIFGALVLGGACAGLVLLGAEWLPRQPERQHLLILGCLVLGVGMARYQQVSVPLAMLAFGVLCRLADQEKKVVASRVADDARICLVIAVVLAGAATDLASLASWWPQALLLGGLRFAGQQAGLLFARRTGEPPLRDSLLAGLALQPMSAMALVLLAGWPQRSGLSDELAGMLMATILLLQLAGPLATQLALKSFGEAPDLRPSLGGAPCEGGPR